jgi:hypothetical protein
MTQLRKIMLEERQRRNFSDATVRLYIRAVKRLSRFFSKSPDKLSPEHNPSVPGTPTRMRTATKNRAATNI